MLNSALSSASLAHLAQVSLIIEHLNATGVYPELPLSPLSPLLKPCPLPSPSRMLMQRRQCGELHLHQRYLSLPWKRRRCHRCNVYCTAVQETREKCRLTQMSEKSPRLVVRKPAFVELWLIYAMLVCRRGTSADDDAQMKTLLPASTVICTRVFRPVLRPQPALIVERLTCNQPSFVSTSV